MCCCGMTGEYDAFISDLYKEHSGGCYVPAGDVLILLDDSFGNGICIWTLDVFIILYFVFFAEFSLSRSGET